MIFEMVWGSFIETLKNFGGFLNDYSALILVVITGIYAYFTRDMAKVMKRQIIADIKVSNVVLGSNFAEDWFKIMVKNTPDKIGKNYSFFEFRLLFDTRNKSSGSGSIDKPILILKFINDNFEYRIFPKTKESWNEKLGEEGVMTTYRTVVNDLGGTIFLRGGESQKIEVEYSLFEPEDNLLRHIKENLNSLEYYIKWIDNLGKRYLIKIEDIKGEREVRRE